MWNNLDFFSFSANPKIMSEQFSRHFSQFETTLMFLIFCNKKIPRGGGWNFVEHRKICAMVDIGE